MKKIANTISVQMVAVMAMIRVAVGTLIPQTEPNVLVTEDTFQDVISGKKRLMCLMTMMTK